MMKKVIGVLLILSLAISTAACSGGGKEGEKKDPVNTGIEKKAAEIGIDKLEGKNNSEKLMYLLTKIGEQKDVNFTGPLMIGQIHLLYKNNIVNPKTGNTSLYAIDRNIRGYYNADKTTAENVSIIAAADEIKIDDPNRGADKTTWGCNKGNAGATLAIIYYEDIYTYEIDDNGKKINEIKKKVKTLN